jgi:hypothetical protein
VPWTTCPAKNTARAAKMVVQVKNMVRCLSRREGKRKVNLRPEETESKWVTVNDLGELKHLRVLTTNVYCKRKSIVIT